MIQEKITVGLGTKYPLKGMLTLPKQTKGPVPAVVFVHGSGSSNMDEKVMKLTPFKDLAQGLAKMGIASIRYDKRTFAHGLKLAFDKSQVITVKEETIEDAVLAADLLREDPRIDKDNIFIVGHSMGAMLAPRIDAEGGNFKGLVLMAGTLHNMEEILVRQTDEILSSSSKFLKLLVGKKLRKIEEQFETMYEVSDEEAKKIKMGNGTTLYYFKEMGEHRAEDYIKNSDKPMLILQGEKDCQVRANIDYVGYQNLLAERDNVTFKLYEGLNHAFVPYVTEDLAKVKKEFSKERHIGDDVIRDLGEWILEVTNKQSF